MPSPRQTDAPRVGLCSGHCRSLTVAALIGRFTPLACLAGMLLLCGCGRWSIDAADREAAALVQSRQQAALGFTTDPDLGAESGSIGSRASMYRFVPSPVDPNVPESFQRATQVKPTTGADDAPGQDAPVERSRRDASAVDSAEEKSPAATAEPPRPFTLADALSYAIHHSRQYQTEKELLYLAALDLTLERYLWTPRFVESVLSFDYENAGELNNFDQALTAVANFAIEQRLPFGGEVTARVINTLMRDLSENVTTGESGQIILEARLPLLRGAGPPAYESRYRSERELVYAVRSFEVFRRAFLADIAGDFFNLLSQKAQIESAQNRAASLARTYERENALAAAERKPPFDADRARVSMLNAQDAAQIARENYETSLDFFKIRLGMPTEEPIDVVDAELDLFDPDVSVAEAVETALKYRLDLATARDRVDDARRGVDIARNNLLPQVDLRGAMTTDTDPERRRSQGYEHDRTRWSAGLDVEVPLDRKQERNDYRSALIALRRAERDHEESVDTVRLEVRRALRRIASARSTITIQQEQIRTNEFRAEMAQAKLDAGEDVSVLDVVDAQDDLAAARNDYAASRSDFRRAVLEFLRDTGTLRVGDDGRWARYDAVAATPPEAGP